MIKYEAGGEVSLNGNIYQLYAEWGSLALHLADKFVAEGFPAVKVKNSFLLAVRVAGLYHGLLLPVEVDCEEEVEDTLEDIIADFEATIMDTRMRLETCDCSDSEIEAAFARMDERIMQAHNKQISHIMDVLKKLEDEPNDND